MSQDQPFGPYVLGVVHRYLAQFPGEEERLFSLLQLLKTPGADLRSRKNMAGHLTASALVIDFTTDRLLLVHHRKLDLWLPPGGHLDDGEAMREAARREVAEEVGSADFRLHAVDAYPDVPVDIDTHVIPAMPRQGEGQHLHHDFRYILSVGGSDWVTANESEIISHQWLSLDELPGRRLAPGLHRSVEKARSAKICKLEKRINGKVITSYPSQDD